MSRMKRHNLPDEIIEEILVKLPVKSMIRCQIVSKSWFDFIEKIKSSDPLIESDSTSLALFFNNYSEKRRSLFLNLFIYDYDDDDDEETSATLLKCFNKGVDRWRKLQECENLDAGRYKLPVPTMLKLKFPPEFERPWLIGHCNGILCLRDSRSFVLVNPLLKEMRRIPIHPGYLGMVGFGFDNITMDFKLIILFIRDPQSKAQVYILRSNAWREIEAIPNFVVDEYTQGSTFFNGAVHWCARIQPFGWQILTFNMATELFQHFDFPQGWNDANRNTAIRPLLFLLNNKESLALVTFPLHYGYIPYSSNPYVIWTMNYYKNGNNQVSWTKLYSLAPLHEIQHPICFPKENKFLYETTTGELILYDLLNHRESILPFRAGYCSGSGYYARRIYLGVGVFKPSFVSINM